MPTLRQVYEEAVARHGKDSRVAKVFKEQMEALEINLLGHLGFPNPYNQLQPSEG